MSDSNKNRAQAEETTAAASSAHVPPPMPDPVPPPPAVAEWVRNTAVPLTAVEAGNGFDDMEPLRAMIGDARLVSLGEATHGTREFFRLKHRMFEFLVEEMGFSWFGIESGFADCMDLHRYVAGADIDPVKALAAQRYWTWNTEEVLDLVRWMRAYNDDPAHDTKLRFYGYDVQTPTCATLATLDYLAEVDAPLAASVEDDLAPLSDDHSVLAYSSVAPELRDRAGRAVQQVLRAFDDNREQWCKATGETEYSLARLNATVMAQGEKQVSIPLASHVMQPESFALRDRFMAENVRTILELQGPGSKGVLWAHNAHVQRTPFVPLDVTSMGGHLHEMFGDAHVVVGFAFNQGSFQAIERNRGLLAHGVPPAKEHSLDAVLAAAVDHPVFALDLRRAPSEMAAWLATKPASRSIGALFSSEWEPRMYGHEDWPEAFDILLFVESTTAAVPVGGRPEPSPGARDAAPSAQATGPALPEALVNGDFASGDIAEDPFGWRTGAAKAAGYRVGLVEREGRRALELVAGPTCHRWSTAPVMQVVSASPFTGRRAKLSATVALAEAGGRSGVYLSLAAYESGDPTAMVQPQPLAADGMQGRPIRSRVPTEHSVEIDVPAEAAQLVVTITFVGQGTATVGDVRLEAT